MSEPQAQRTLVKSPPELWAEVSDVSLLARHLGEFGDIRITRLEAETTVVWEGDRARGTVELEPSGWGTKVTITAEAITVEEAPAVDETPPAEAPTTGVEAEVEVVEVEVEAQETPIAEPLPALRRRGFFARLLRRRAAAIAPEPEVAPVAAEIAEPEPEVAPEPVAEVAPEPDPEPVAEPELDVEAVLVGVLDDLGSAHHRPFSRG